MSHPRGNEHESTASGTNALPFGVPGGWALGLWMKSVKAVALRLTRAEGTVSFKVTFASGLRRELCTPIANVPDTPWSPAPRVTVRAPPVTLAPSGNKNPAVALGQQ